LHVGVCRIVVRVDGGVLVTDKHRDFYPCVTRQQLVDVYVGRHIICCGFIACSFADLRAHTSKAKGGVSQRAGYGGKIRELSAQCSADGPPGSAVERSNAQFVGPDANGMRSAVVTLRISYSD